MAATDEARLLVRLEASTTKLASELRRAGKLVDDFSGQTDRRVRRSNQTVTEGLARQGRALRENASGYSAVGAAVQNTAFQVGDFAVQVAAGTDASRALAQQLPQLLGGFGVAGAVLGAVAAIAAPLAANFLFAAEEIKKIDAISLDQVRSRLGELKTLQEQYNEVVALSGTTAEENTRRQLSALDQEYQAKLALFRLEAVTLEQRKRQLEAGIEQQRRQVEELTAAVNALDDPDQSSAAFVRTRQQSEQLALVQKIIAENKDLFLEIQRQSAELDLVNLSLSEAEGILSTAGSLAAGFASALGGAAGNAGALAENLRIARGNYINGLLDSGISGPDAARRATQWAGQPRTAPQPTGAGAAFRAPSTGGGTGGGSRANPQDFLQQRLDLAQRAAEAAQLEARAIMMGAEAAAREKAKLDLLNEAKRQKLDLDKKNTATGMTLREEIDRQAESIGRLTVQTDRYREQTQFAQDNVQTLKDGFLDAIVEGENLSGTLEKLAKSLARAALEAALFGSGPFSGGGGGGGLLGGLLGGIFGGFRAEGGPVRAGRAYVVGEEGPELMVPRTSGTIIPNGGGKGGGVTLSVSIDARGAQAGVAEQIDARLRQVLPQIVRQSVQGVGAARKRGM